MGLHKIIKIIGLLLSVISIVLFVMIFLMGNEAIEARYLAGEEVASVTWSMYIAYITLAIIVLFVLVFVLKGIFAGNVKKTLLSIGGFLLVGIVSYVLASNSIIGLPEYDGKMITPGASKWVGAGLITFYILGVVAIGAMVFSGIKKLTNR